uniref:P0041A24.7 protein n=1 Tax=Oryza sativa subsp. japonica TaxID=39947 RepID=Q7X8Q0_ORYSJ|nr:P0041A24.7 [Oryza sativa Japonica Group]
MEERAWLVGRRSCLCFDDKSENAWKSRVGVLYVMHPITFFTNIIGVVTIVLISIVSILGLICLCHSLNFQLLIKRRRRNYYQANDEQLSYFNGPWLTRITLILVALWWGVGEVLRLTFVNGEGRFISDQTWQANVCKFYIVSNLGFAEPGLFLLLAFLLSAALQNQEVGALNRKWNQRTICAVFMLCSPSLIWEACVVFIGPHIASNDGQTSKVAKYWYSASSVHDGDVACTYPLLSSIFLGTFYTVLTLYVIFVGGQILSLVINKGLRRRIYMLIFATGILLPRAMFLGFSVLPWPGEIVHESLVFVSFLVLMIAAMLGIVILVYFPVAETFEVRNQEHIELQTSHSIAL